MKERIVQLLDLEQLTPSKFADIIGVQRSSVSHVISGRNKPSFDFLEKTLKAFPGLNAEWLIMGKGTMYEQMGRGPSGTLFDLPDKQLDDRLTQDKGGMEDREYPDTEQEPEPEYPGKGTVDKVEISDRSEPVQPDSASRKIIRVLVIYDDNTFSAYGPSL